MSQPPEAAAAYVPPASAASAPPAALLNDGPVPVFLRSNGLGHLVAHFEDKCYDDLKLVTEHVDAVAKELSAADAHALRLALGLGASQSYAQIVSSGGSVALNFHATPAAVRGMADPARAAAAPAAAVPPAFSLSQTPPAAGSYAPPSSPSPSHHPVESLLNGAGLSDLIDVFADLGFDDVEAIKEHFSSPDGVLHKLEEQGTRLTAAQQQALREKLGLVSVEVAELLKKCQLEQYAEQFHEEGFDDVKVIQMYVTDVLEDIRMKPDEEERLRRALGTPAPPLGGRPPEPASEPQPWTPPPGMVGRCEPPPSEWAPAPSPQPALPTAPARPSTVTLDKNEPWGMTVHRLTKQGNMWREPTRHELDTANEELFGKKLVVAGFGQGNCIRLEKKSGMQRHSLHVIDFSPQPHGVQRVSLKKKSNNETPWLIWNLCVHCSRRPQFHDKGKPTPYCGKTCKSQADRGEPPPTTPPNVPPVARAVASHPPGQLPAAVPSPLGPPPSTAPPTPLSSWLKSVRLEHLFAAFTAAGYDDLDLLKDDFMSADELASEVTNGNAADKDKLVQCLTSLRAPAVDYGELAQWLASVALGDYTQAIGGAGYDLTTIRSLTDDELKDLAESVIPATLGGHRVKLKMAVKKLRASTSTGSAPTTPAPAPAQPADDDAQKRLAEEMIKKNAERLWVEEMIKKNSAMMVPAADPATSPPAPAPTTPTATPTVPPAGMCPYCHVVHQRATPVHPGHPYCGKKCGKAASSAGWIDGAPSQPLDALTPQLSAATAAKVCSFCKTRPRFEGSLYCGKRCMASAKEAASPGLRRLDKDQQGRDHKKFVQISQQFVNKWMHPDGGGMKKPDKSDIIDIFECQCGPGVSRAHEQYRQQLEDKGVRRHKQGGKGNAQQRWHGTAIKCSLGRGQPTICDDRSCATCNIIRSGFDISYVRTAGRYGIGLYASSTSSKAHQYAAGMSAEIGGRTAQDQPSLMDQDTTALLLCSVAVGKGHLETSANWGGQQVDGKLMYMPWCTCGHPATCSCPNDGTRRITTPPTGCDSVLAQPGTGLNYDEVAVYCNEAIIPRYLVVYKYQYQ